jgi:hypothetical protein
MAGLVTTLPVDYPSSDFYLENKTLSRLRAAFLLAFSHNRKIGDALTAILKFLLTLHHAGPLTG